MNNPILKNNYADPFVYKDGNDYYLVATTELTGSEDKISTDYFEISHSTDLKEWSTPKTILDLKDVSWAKTNAWAPTITKYNGFWYFAFCGERQIGIAVCDIPCGTYKDVMEKPILPRDCMNVQTIDPSLFVDDDGKAYIIWGSGKCFMSEIFLSPNDIHLVGKIYNISNEFYFQRSHNCDEYNPSIFTEGADLMKYNGKYLLTWSVYDFRDYRYNIRYAWADKVTGPYIQPIDEDTDNILIIREKGITATGHGNIVPYKDELYSFYHRRVMGSGNYSREICCDKVNVDGKHLAVYATK